MLLLQIFAAVTAVTLVVLAYYLIPTVVEMRKTAAALRAVAESVQSDLKPLIKDLSEVVADVKVVTSATAANAEGIGLFMEELGHAGHNIRMINKVLGVASTIASASSAWINGAQVAGRFIADRIFRKNKA
jgi:uncharacterized protein YoxC